jgi:alkaline phosphatase D
MNRRQFVTAAGSAAAAVVLAPPAWAGGGGRAAPLARGGRFAEGVMSGEPTPRSIALWTRVHDLEGRVAVDLEVARDRGFGDVVARRRLTTSEARGHAVKARLDGLRPHEQYFYRFSTATREGPVGRFRTALPADSRQPVRFAFYSCQEYAHGYYNAHEVMADDDLDFVVCLGDYIYADASSSVARGDGVRDDEVGREIGGRRFAYSLEDYRGKYALYRSDESLRRVQRRFPTVLIWDDHEVQDNYAGGEPDGGLPSELGYSRVRRRAAYRAFFESTPFTPQRRDRIYRSLSFGRTVDLILMDQRQYREDQPCGDALAAPACADFDQPRDFLGRRQMRWVKDRLRSSQAAWKVLANQVMVMPVRGPSSLLGFDSWQGYAREREELLTYIRDRQIKDVVFVTGDIHVFVAGDVRTRLGDGETVALEFVGGSITSRSLGERDIDVGGAVIEGNDANPMTPPAIIEALRALNPWADNADLDHHGYGRVVATKEDLTVDLVRVQTIKRRSTALLPAEGYRYRVQRGQTSIKGVNGPPAAAPTA